VSQAGKGVGGKCHIAFVTHDQVAKCIFSLQDAIKQGAGLATGHTEDVRGSALKQEFGKMIACVHKESIGPD
jgi:hypothetical protein